MIDNQPPLTLAIFCAGISAVILVVYLVRRPPLVGATKLWLLLGLGVFPIGAAAAGNIEGFRATKQRVFCGSCHVMVPHASDSNDGGSSSLASRHARNQLFGGENCYVCHADYGMYGTILTKLGGMRHVWMYATEYKDVPIDEAKRGSTCASRIRTTTACSAIRRSSTYGCAFPITSRRSTTSVPAG
jgi:cytochrome c-type protein NapC